MMDFLEQSFLFLERIADSLLGPFQFGLFPGFLQGSPNRGNQPGQALLQDIIGGPALQALNGLLLAERAGEQDERHLRPLRPGETQRRQAVIAWNREVREDEIEMILRERGLES